MKPVMVNGEVWQVKQVSPSSPLLIDRTGKLRLATTDPTLRVIHISNAILSPLLDQVLLHEVAHAITISHGLLAPLRFNLPPELWVVVEEWSAELLEKHAVEAIIATSESLGRPLCIKGQCL